MSYSVIVKIQFRFLLLFVITPSYDTDRIESPKKETQAHAASRFYDTAKTSEL